MLKNSEFVKVIPGSRKAIGNRQSGLSLYAKQHYCITCGQMIEVTKMFDIAKPGISYNRPIEENDDETASYVKGYN